MYFSSNRKNGFGGFDIYKSEGRLNLWREPENVKELNTKKDDLYLTFYDEKSGYFSSNRVGSKFQNTEYCCNDIFSFEYLSSSNIDTNKATSEIHDYLPLDLYFHNDEPDPNTTKTTTKKTYKEAYTSYFMMKPDYEKNNPNTNIFFEETLLKNFNILNKVLEMLVFDLKKGNNMELQIRGYASPLHNHVYNQKLSQRRISSFMNYLVQFKQGDLKEYISSEKLIITKLPFGESNASDKVSDDSNDKKKSVYSIEAMLERKIEIVDIILKD
jgi:outer membrane protein OmpA-like peptidoglycan-associated protein